jgi:UDP-N-acetylmuramoyl-tripeptide--D-alanyl-D-alanine ligase
MIYVALKGERFNGNRFAKTALEAGAMAVIADEAVAEGNERMIFVKDALQALQQLARLHRRSIHPRLIAVAGSNGKTTTKELISRVLASSFQTFSTQGNLNNHIGVPLSLLSIQEGTVFAVIEIGANHLGETKRLCEIAEPDFGLITNNGKDHLEGYGSIEGVRKGNGEMFEFLRERGGTAFVCSDQADLMDMSRGLTRYTYGSNHRPDAAGLVKAVFPFLQLEIKNADPETPVLNLQTRLLGRYNFDNVMAAVAIGKFFRLPAEKIRQAIESYVPSANRSQVLVRGSNTFILDAYNANPSSMDAALESFLSLPAAGKVIVLGDMAELGAASESEHAAVVKKLKAAGAKNVWLVGKEFAKAAEKCTAGFHCFADVHELKDWFRQQPWESTFFLLKASRFMKLEELLAD